MNWMGKEEMNIYIYWQASCKENLPDIAADGSTITGSCEDVNWTELARFRNQWKVFNDCNRRPSSMVKGSF
jgi:hypothetical protein